MLQTPDSKDTLYVDIGSYGTPLVKNFHPIETTKRVEEFVRRVKGFVILKIVYFIQLSLCFFLNL